MFLMYNKTKTKVVKKTRLLFEIISLQSREDIYLGAFR